MSSYRESFQAASTEREGLPNIPAAFRSRFPALSEVLGGIVEEGTGKLSIPAATLNLFWEGGELKFCIIPRFGNRVAFGSVPEPHKGIESLEREIAAGRVGWKISKNKRTA